MVSFIRNWTEGIIIAIIIGIIIEMIIPEGNLKKYVKVVIGVYIMFNIVSPIINHFSSKSISFSIDDYEVYYKKNDIYNDLNSNLENEKNKQIESIYTEELILDISKKLNDKGYAASNIEIDINTNNTEDYGKIVDLSLDIKLDKDKDNNNIKVHNTNNNVNTIKKITINKRKVENKQENEKEYKQEYKLEEQHYDVEIEKINIIKEFLSSEYGIDINCIKINQL